MTVLLVLDEFLDELGLWVLAALVVVWIFIHEFVIGVVVVFGFGFVLVRHHLNTLPLVVRVSHLMLTLEHLPLSLALGLSVSHWRLLVHDGLLPYNFVCLLEVVPLRIALGDDLRHVSLIVDLGDLVLLHVI